MGGSESKNEEQKFENFIINYKNPRNVRDFRFGEVVTYTSNNNINELALVKEKWSINKEDFESMKGYIQRRESFKHPNLCELYSYSGKTELEWCSNYYKNFICYEYFDECLGDELRRRRRLPQEDEIEKYMPEPEVWYIIGALGAVVKCLRDHGLYHGDIQPNNILINGNQEIKLLETPVLTHYKDGYERLLHEKNYYSPLSPQQLNSLRKREPQSYGSAEKNEIFSIGITALCSVVNNPITSFYDFREYIVIFDKIMEKLQLMQSLGYSRELINIIGNMCSEKEEQRPTLESLCTYILPHTDGNLMVQPSNSSGPGLYGSSNGYNGKSIVNQQPGNYSYSQYH